MSESDPASLAQDIVFKFIFEDDKRRVSDVPFEALDYEPVGDGSGQIDIYYGGEDDGYSDRDNPAMYWHEDGTLHNSPGGINQGFYTIGKFGPGGFLTFYEGHPSVEGGWPYAGENFATAGAGAESWESSLHPRGQANSPRQFTMVKAVASHPVVQNLLKGLDPRTGSDSSDDAKLVRGVLTKFRKQYGEKFAGKIISAFDTWPKLMLFLKEVNDAFDKKSKKSNPVRELLFNGNYAGTMSPLSGMSRVGFARREGETDKEFYERQLKEIDTWLHDDYKDKETGKGRLLTDDQYYNWVIDNMVENIERVARALKSKEEELNAKNKQKNEWVVNTYGDRKKVAEEEGKAYYAKNKDDIQYLMGLENLRKRYLEKRIPDVEKAIAKIAEFKKSSSIESRLEAIEARGAQIDTFLENEKKLAAISPEGESEEEAKARKLRFSRAKRIHKGWIDALDGGKKDLLKGTEANDSTQQVLKWLNEYKDKLKESLKEVGEILEGDKGRALREYKAILARRNEKLNMSRISKLGRYMLYQMAVPRDQLVELADVESGEQAAIQYLSSNAKIVAAGILLGNTGQSLDDVLSSCRKYKRLRRSFRGSKPKNAQTAFLEVFGVDPTRIPSDERLKDFHRGWRNVEDGMARGRRIVEAVGRRFC